MFYPGVQQCSREARAGVNARTQTMTSVKYYYSIQILALQDSSLLWSICSTDPFIGENKIQIFSKAKFNYLNRTFYLFKQAERPKLQIWIIR